MVLWALLCSGPAVAKDTARLWYFGLGPGYLFTPDDARSNAALTGDIRPDRFEDREIDVEDGTRYGFTAGMGLTSHLSLQLDTGYFKGEVGPVDAYLADSFPVIDPFNPTTVARIETRALTVPITAGTLTEIPVSLTGILRFRKDRSLNPYLGAGLGMLFTELDRSSEVDELNERLENLRVEAVYDEHGQELTPTRLQDLRENGDVPLRHRVTVDTEDSVEWHLAGGMEFFFHDRMSLTLDARYMWAGTSVTIDLEGEDQVTYLYYGERLFRKDGSLRFFNDKQASPNPFIDPNDISKGRIKCTADTRGDFDRDGHVDDLCFSLALGGSSPEGNFLVQGGEINLSGFTVQLGLRMWF